MKLSVITILNFGHLSCNISTAKNSIDNETAKDSLVHIDGFYINKNEISGGSEYNEFYDCDFYKFVNDPKTPKIAKCYGTHTTKQRETNDNKRMQRKPNP